MSDSCLPRTSRRRPAFTAIELMVVIFIIALLISLLLPAVQQAREAARRTQCMNNLLQIGIALHSYHHTHHTLPPGCVDTVGPVKNDGNGYQMSWVVQILPYLDEANAYQRIDFTRGAYQQQDPDLKLYALPMFRCPSSSGSSSYAGCQNDIEAPIDVNNNGVLFLNSRIRFRDLTDGARHTLLLGESGASNSWLAGTGATLRNMGGFNDPAGENYMTGQRDYYGTTSSTPVPENANDPVDPLLYVGGFGSAHGAGANFCFADGNVRYISCYVDENILKRIANRNDGQLIGQF